MQRARPRRRHRVPAHRRHAGRAEGPAPAARLADVDLDEELALWEERDLLLARLLECKTFKDVATVFARLADDADCSFPRLVGPDERFADVMPDLLEGTSLDAAAQRRHPRADTRARCRRSTCSTSTRSRTTVADAVAELIDELPRVGRISFRRLTGDLVERLEVIVRFLAVLELFKQGVVELDQAERFGDIEIEWCAGDDVDGDDDPRRRLRRMTRCDDDRERRTMPSSRSPSSSGRSRRSCSSPTTRWRPSCWPSCSSSRRRRSSAGATSCAAEYATAGARLRAGPGRRRLPLPDRTPT